VGGVLSTDAAMPSFSAPADRSRARHASGFSLIELLLVLGVLAVLLVAAFVIYPQVTHSNRVNAEISNLTTIQANMRGMFASQGGYYSSLPADSTAVLNAARVFPRSMNGGDYSAAGSIQNAWGGAVILTATGSAHQGVPAGRGFSISYSKLPSAACVDLVTRSVKVFKVVHVYPTDGGSAAGKFYPETDALASIVTACNQSDASRVLFISN